MNEDWRPGDLAQCIADDWIIPTGEDPKIGDILRVTKVLDLTGDYPNAGRVRFYALRFEGKRWQGGWETAAFRKLRPVLEPAEEEFTNLIKRPVRQPQPVHQ